MDWFIRFWPFFWAPCALFTLLFAGGWLSDNSSYPWKHWRRDQSISAFIFGPAIGSILAAIMMLVALISLPFNFEKWWLAISLLVIGLWSLTVAVEHFVAEDSLDEKTRKQLLRKEYDVKHPISTDY
ncbi:MAG: hypothetical protein AAB941_00820 [Patescibacteria group bacterium]